MAIDSAAKRASAAAVSLEMPMVIPDGTIDQADRQTIAYMYGGIAASAPAGAARRRQHIRTSTWRHHVRGRF